MVLQNGIGDNKRKTLLKSLLVIPGVTLLLCSCDSESKKKIEFKEEDLTYSTYEVGGYTYDAYMTSDSFLYLKYNDKEVYGEVQHITYEYEKDNLQSKSVDTTEYSYVYNETVLKTGETESEVTPFTTLDSFISYVKTAEEKDYVNVGDSIIKALTWTSVAGYYSSTSLKSDYEQVTFAVPYDDFDSSANPYFSLFPSYDRENDQVSPFTDTLGNKRDINVCFMLSSDHKTVYPCYTMSCDHITEDYINLNPLYMDDSYKSVYNVYTPVTTEA